MLNNKQLTILKFVNIMQNINVKKLVTLKGNNF